MTDVFVYCALAALWLTLGEVFLSPAQKEALTLRITAIWNWIDGARQFLQKDIWFQRVLASGHKQLTTRFHQTVAIVIASIGEFAVSVLLVWYGGEAPNAFVQGAIILIAVFLLLGFVLLCWEITIGVLILMPLAAVYAALGILWLCEFTLRRIAEYPRGPILALSAVIAAVTTFLRSLK